MDSLRNFLTGPRLLIVVLFCALPFVFLGTSSLGTIFNTSFGTINGEEVNDIDLQIASDITVQKFKTIYGEDFDFDMLDDQIKSDAIKQELIFQKSLLSGAKSLGFVNKSSERETKKNIIKSPNFQFEGEFSEDIFEAQVNSRGFTKDKSIFFIPKEKYAQFVSQENPFNSINNINWITHTVKRGDNLWDLSIKFDTEVNIIKEVNYLNNDILSINDTLLIPLSKTKSNDFIPYQMYIVSEGDTLWGIAEKYNLDVEDLAKMNSLNKNEYLQLGQQLSIGNKNIYRNIESRKRTILYSVKQGDNLFKISELFDVTIKSIEEINNFNQATLMPGQIIKIAIRAF